MRFSDGTLVFIFTPREKGFVRISLPYTQANLLEFESAFGQISLGSQGWHLGGSRLLMHKVKQWETKLL